jgi:pteridine reductase
VLRREGSAADIAAAVTYLASADYVTGAVLPVDGGRLLS